MKQHYITAVLEELQAGTDPDVVLSGLKKTLERKGHTRLYAPVLRRVVRVLEAGSRESISVTVARAGDYEVHKAAIQAALQKLGVNDEPSIQTDSTIVGGFVAEANSTRIDASYKSKLVTLYRSLTK